MQRNLPRLACESRLQCSSNLKLWIKDSFVSLQNSFFFFCCCSGGRWMSVSSDIRTSTEVHFQLAFLAKNNEIGLPFLSHSHYHSDSNSFSLPLSLFLTLVLFFLSYLHSHDRTHTRLAFILQPDSQIQPQPLVFGLFQMDLFLELWR